MIAVSENGKVRCSPVNNFNIQEKRSHEAWLAELRADHTNWVLKTIKTVVPMPLQFEEIP